MKVLVAQSCRAVWSSMDYSPPGSSVHRILQARILEWVANSFSRGSFWPRDRTWVSHIAGRFFSIWANTPNPKEMPSEFFSSKSFTSKGTWRLVYSDACQSHLIKSRLLTCTDLAIGRCFSFKLMTHHCWDRDLFALSCMGKITFLIQHFSIMLFLLYYQQRMTLERQPYLRRMLRLRFCLRKTNVNVTVPTLYNTSQVRTCQEEQRLLISEPTLSWNGNRVCEQSSDLYFYLLL